MPTPLAIETRIPLVVDLDGTLTLTDTLYESFIALAFRRPLTAAACLLRLRSGLAPFKREVARHVLPDPATLPYRAELIELIKAEKARGRAVHLVTASDQAVADAVAAELGVFDSATGSDGATNRKGENKLATLRARFPEGFIYAGDEAADVPIFRAAAGAILCDASAATAAAIGATPVLASFERPATTWRTWVRALRVHQWSKNLLIFVPLFTSHAYSEGGAIVAAALGFAILCIVASATYMVNDLADIEADRLHATKRARPFASGALSVKAALFTAPLMTLIAFAAAYWLAPRFAFALLAYLVLTLFYSFGLKRLPLFDVFVIAALFTQRIVMGSEAVGIGHSPWLLSFAFAFFLSLALAKRHGEVVRASRIDVEEIAGRGYRGDDWPVTLTFGVGTGLVSVIIMLLYMTNDATPSGLYHHPAWLYAIPGLITVWLMRIWLLSHRMQLHDDPVVFALTDRASLVLGLCAFIAFYLAI